MVNRKLEKLSKEQLLNKLIDSEKLIKSLLSKNKRLSTTNNNLRRTKNRVIATKNRVIATSIRKQKVINNLKSQAAQNYKNIYQYCPKTIYLKYDSKQIGKQLKKLNRKNNFNLNRLKMILNKLNSSRNQQKINPDKHVNKIINNKMGNKINESKFFGSVENAVININKTWPNPEIKLLKSELDNIDYSNFDFDNPLSNLKMESFLDLLLIPANNFNINNNISIKILGIKNCTEIPLVKGIEFIDPYTKTKNIFNKEFIKRQITSNIGIINSYYKMLQKFTDTIHLELAELKDKIVNMIDSTHIYFCDMPINTCGLTISNGNIYVTGDYLYEALGETKKYKCLKNKESKCKYIFTAICKIYLTLLHEFSHKLHYLVRKKQSKNDSWKDNFFDHSEEIQVNKNLEYFINLDRGSYRNQKKMDYTKLHKNIILHESGEFFDRELYLGNPISEVDENICKFFLSENCSSHADYIRKMNNLKNNNNKQSIRSSNSRFKIIENSSRCYFSFLRNI